jgi:hypothetical protein
MALPNWSRIVQSRGILWIWCPGAGSNHRHCDFQSHALPTELPGHCPARGQGAPVYSQAGQPCPPGFAGLSGIARRATTDGYAGHGPASCHQPNCWEIRLILPRGSWMEAKHGKFAASRSGRPSPCPSAACAVRQLAGNHSPWRAGMTSIVGRIFCLQSHRKPVVGQGHGRFTNCVKME